MKVSSEFVWALLVILTVFTICFSGWHTVPYAEKWAMYAFNKTEKHCYNHYLHAVCITVESKIAP